MSYFQLMLPFLLQLLVAVVSSFGSPRLAALVSTAPSGTPLTILAVDTRNAEAGIPARERQAKLLSFVEASAAGVSSTAAFVAAAWLVARAGGGVWAVLASGFAAYFLWTSGTRELQLFYVLSAAFGAAWLVSTVPRPSSLASTASPRL